MSAPRYIEKVAIVGASGNVASHCVTALLATGKHTVTAIARSESTSTFPEGVHVSHVDFTSTTALEVALRGQDFLMITLSSAAPPELHARIVKAAVAAGVPYVMPNSYGYDVLNERLAKEELYTQMSAAKIKEVEDAGGKWVGMTCGCWYEWHAFAFLGDSSFGIDINKREVTFFDQGIAKVKVSTWKRCGEALAALLSLPVTGTSPSVDDWANKSFKFHSWEVSQRDMLNSLNRAMELTDADWSIKYEKSEDRVKEGLESMKKGNMLGFAKAMYSRFFYETSGFTDVAYESSNEALGLGKESFDEQTRKIVEAVLKA